MTKPAKPTIFRLIKTLIIFIFVLIIISFVVVLCEGIIGDFLWKLFSGEYIANFNFWASFIQLSISTVVILFFWIGTFRLSSVGAYFDSKLLQKHIGFEFLQFPEDFFFGEEYLTEKRKARYLVFYRFPYVIQILGNKFINISSIFSDHVLSIGKIDIFLYRACWAVLFGTLVIGSLFKNAITIMNFRIGIRLAYEMIIILSIFVLSWYLGYMMARRSIAERDRFAPGLILRNKYISLHLPANNISCIYICPVERIGEFDQKRAEHLCASFIRVKELKNIYNGKQINADLLKEWASAEKSPTNLDRESL